MMDENRAGIAVAGHKVRDHEQAAHEKRNWVRLTFDCNDRCIFCLDAHTHTGEMRAIDDVREQILDGRRKGAERLILSGGEPTIHPNYVDFIRLGRMAGYAWIQTVTNGRLFSYADFLTRCVDQGLSEITFSIHGPNAKVHDALVGTKGAYEQEIRGLENALADGRVVVNIDIVINRANVKHLPEMLQKYSAMGVKEFDLLQVVPFGRAFTEGRDTLFYDLREARPYLLEALEFSRRPDVHIWMNRFPPEHLEGFEHLIQDPYKLNDEVRGRKEEFALLLDWGTELDCRDPNRCRYCYLQRLCDTLENVRDRHAKRSFEVVRIDTKWEAKQAPVFGGDPASARRAESDGRRRLPLATPDGKPQVAALPVVVAAAKPRALWLVAPDLERAMSELGRYPGVTSIELELSDYTGLGAALEQDAPFGDARLERVVARTPEEATYLLALAGTFEVVVILSKATEQWLLGVERPSPRLALRMPTWERLSDSGSQDVDLADFFTRFRDPVPVEGVPPCVLGRPARPERVVLDTAMMTPDGRLEIFRYASRYILDHYFTKSLRCTQCIHDATCRGLHVNYVRAHGYGALQPITLDAPN
ncbi:MAG TPA: radical SAM protein [Polyangiaceae bacterium]|nr:radical SAM protein [Polyangiaceae bacterium]